MFPYPQHGTPQKMHLCISNCCKQITTQQGTLESIKLGEMTLKGAGKILIGDLIMLDAKHVFNGFTSVNLSSNYNMHTRTYAYNGEW